MMLSRLWLGDPEGSRIPVADSCSLARVPCTFLAGTGFSADVIGGVLLIVCGCKKRKDPARIVRQFPVERWRLLWDVSHFCCGLFVFLRTLWPCVWDSFEGAGLWMRRCHVNRSLSIPIRSGTPRASRLGSWGMLYWLLDSFVSWWVAQECWRIVAMFEMQRDPWGSSRCLKLLEGSLPSCPTPLSFYDPSSSFAALLQVIPSFRWFRIIGVSFRLIPIQRLWLRRQFASRILQHPSVFPHGMITYSGKRKRKKKPSRSHAPGITGGANTQRQKERNKQKQTKGENAAIASTGETCETAGRWRVSERPAAAAEAGLFGLPLPEFVLPCVATMCGEPGLR